MLFQRDKSVISWHIRNVFEEEELEERATVAKFATVQNEKGRLVERQIDYYNLIEQFSGIGRKTIEQFKRKLYLCRSEINKEKPAYNKRFYENWECMFANE